MMRLALLLPIWLVFAVGEPSLVHSCPRHGGALAPQALSDPHAEHTPAHSHQQAPHSRHTCSCIGTCTAAAAAVVPTSPAIDVPVLSSRAPIVPPTPIRVARFDGQHLLPFPNGPPTPRV